jgi:hypothetical protein
MAYSETLYLVQGDTLPQLKVTVRDRNLAAAGKVLDPEDPTTWALVNLTGGTVRLRVREIGGSTVKSTLVGTNTNAVGGEVVFVFDATTLDTSGVFEGEIEYTEAGGGKQTVYDLIKLQIREQFA